MRGAAELPMRAYDTMIAPEAGVGCDEVFGEER